MKSFTKIICPIIFPVNFHSRWLLKHVLCAVRPFIAQSWIVFTNFLNIIHDKTYENESNISLNPKSIITAIFYLRFNNLTNTCDSLFYFLNYEIKNFIPASLKCLWIFTVHNLFNAGKCGLIRLNFRDRIDSDPLTW